MAVAGDFRSWPASAAAPARRPARILGANDRVVLASIGIRGQGNSLKRGFARLPNVEIKTLCDIDANLAPERINDARLKDVATFKPGFVQDLRRVLDDKDIDAIVIATPNHWHALATIWGLQAGKHVFVEKPASHTFLEGRQMIEAAARYKKLVQVGTMNRSRKPVRDAIKFIHEGGIGKVYMARGLCFKPRPPIGKYPDGPMAPGEKYALTVGSTNYEPTYDEQYLSKVDYDLWLGPAPKRPFNRNRFHYNWHWHWDYGDGDTGNQGPHQFDVARWGLNKQEHPVRSNRRAATSAPRPRKRRRTCTRRCSSTPTAPSSSSRRAAVSPTTKARSESAICSTARRAGCGSTATAGNGSRTSARRTRRVQGWTSRTRTRAAAIRSFSPGPSRRTTRISSTRFVPMTPSC